MAGGVLGDLLGLRVALLVGGGGTLLASVWLLTNRIHGVRQLDDIEPAQLQDSRNSPD